MSEARRKMWWRAAVATVVGGGVVTGGWFGVTSWATANTPQANTPLPNTASQPGEWTRQAASQTPPPPFKTPPDEPPADVNVVPAGATIPAVPPVVVVPAVPMPPDKPQPEPTIPAPAPIVPPAVPAPSGPDADVTGTMPPPAIPAIPPAEVPKLADVSPTMPAVPDTPSGDVSPMTPPKPPTGMDPTSSSASPGVGIPAVPTIPPIEAPEPPVGLPAPPAPPTYTNPAIPTPTPPTIPSIPATPEPEVVTPTLPSPTPLIPPSEPVNPTTPTQPVQPVKPDSPLPKNNTEATVKPKAKDGVPLPATPITPVAPPKMDLVPSVPSVPTIPQPEPPAAPTAPATPVTPQQPSSERPKPVDEPLPMSEKDVFALPTSQPDNHTEPSTGDNPMTPYSRTAAAAVLSGMLFTPTNTIAAPQGGKQLDPKEDPAALKTQLETTNQKLDSIQQQLKELTELLNGKKDEKGFPLPSDPGLVAQMKSLTDRIAAIEKDISDLKKTQTSLRPPNPDGSSIPGATVDPMAGKGTVRVVNEYPVQISIVVNGTSYRVAPSKSVDITVPAGEFTYQLLESGAAETKSSLKEKETVTLRVK